MIRLTGIDSFAALERSVAGLVMVMALAVAAATLGAAGLGQWLVGLKLGLASMALGGWCGLRQVRRLREGRDCWAARLLNLSFLVATSVEGEERVAAEAQVGALASEWEREIVRLLSHSMQQDREAGAAAPASAAEQLAQDAQATLAEMEMYKSATLDLSASVSRVVAQLSEARTRVERSTRTADQVVVRLFDTVAEGSSGHDGVGSLRFCRTQGVTQLSGQALAAE